MGVYLDGAEAQARLGFFEERICELFGVSNSTPSRYASPTKNADINFVLQDRFVNHYTVIVESQMPEALTPLYRTESLNESVLLAKNETVHFETQVGTATGEADIFLRWLPRPRIFFEVEITSLETEPLSDFPDEGKLFLPRRNASAEVNVVYSKGPLTSQLELEGRSFSTGRSDALAQVIFALPNFCNYKGERLILEAEGWRVTLKAHSDTEHLSAALNKEGGHAITHVARIVRTNGGQFTTGEAKSVIASLALFFSFARGISLAPILAVGFDSEGRRVWEDWTIRMISRWEPDTDSWFDLYHPDQLERLFPKFLTTLENSPWEKTIPSVLYWHEKSNKNTAAAGTDGSLILSHAALELLAWTLLVKDRQLMNESDFGHATGKKIAALLTELDVTTAIPEHLKHLDQLAYQWDHGPHAVNDLRNDIVHPKKETEASTQVYFEAWTMAQWFIELALLSLFDYNGTYANRTKWNRWEGKVEPVPWT